MATRSEATDLKDMIGPSFDAADAYLYVYRPDARGKPEGEYVKRYDRRVELEDLRRDVGAGMWLLIQNRGGANGGIVRRTVFVPHEKNAGVLDVAATPVNGDPVSGVINQLREVVAMNMLRDQMTPRGNSMDPIAMLRAVTEIIRGTQPPADPLKVLDQYAGRWNNGAAAVDDDAPDDPTAALLSMGARALGDRLNPSPPAPAGLSLAMLKRVINAFDERMARIEAAVQSQTVKGAEPMSLSLLEVFQTMMLGKYETAERVTTALRLIDKGMGGGLRAELATLPADDISAHLRQGLEEMGRADEFDVFNNGVRGFLA